MCCTNPFEFCCILPNFAFAAKSNIHPAGLGPMFQIMFGLRVVLRESPSMLTMVMTMRFVHCVVTRRILPHVPSVSCLAIMIAWTSTLVTR